MTIKFNTLHYAGTSGNPADKAGVNGNIIWVLDVATPLWESAFTDNDAKDKDTGERRAVTLLVSGGQVSFCANGDSRPACKYDVDLTGATCNEYGGCEHENK